MIVWPEFGKSGLGLLRLLRDAADVDHEIVVRKRQNKNSFDLKCIVAIQLVVFLGKSLLNEGAYLEATQGRIL